MYERCLRLLPVYRHNAVSDLAENFDQKVIANLQPHVARFRREHVAFIRKNFARNRRATVLMNVCQKSVSLFRVLHLQKLRPSFLLLQLGLGRQSASLELCRSLVVQSEKAASSQLKRNKAQQACGSCPKGI